MRRLIARVWFKSILVRVYLATRRPWCWFVGLPSMEELERQAEYTYRAYGIK